MVLGWDSVGMCDYNMLCYKDRVWPRMAAQPHLAPLKMCSSSNTNRDCIREKDCAMKTEFKKKSGEKRDSDVLKIRY